MEALQSLAEFGLAGAVIAALIGFLVFMFKEFTRLIKEVDKRHLDAKAQSDARYLAARKEQDERHILERKELNEKQKTSHEYIVAKIEQIILLITQKYD
jgi:hypothetical protein